MVSLLYLARPVYGGWVSFTAHLQLTTGFPLFKMAKRTEKKKREFGYDVRYKNTKDLPEGPLCITAIDKHLYDLLPQMPNGTHIVVHDPTELTRTLREHLPRFKVIIIRPSMSEHLPDAKFIPHPFYKFPLLEHHPIHPLCLSRLDYDKNIDLILKANQSGAAPHVMIYGALNRLYAHHKLQDLPLEEHYNGSFPKTFFDIALILAMGSCLVDMSSIKGDGGGMQYTFLEAIYAGLPLILHKKWTEVPGSIFIDGQNCLAVETPEELIAALNKEEKPLATELLEIHVAAGWGAALSGGS